MISPQAGASAELGSPTSRLLCSKPDVLLGLTQAPNVNMREEEHDDHVFPGDS